MEPKWYLRYTQKCHFLVRCQKCDPFFRGGSFLRGVSILGSLFEKSSYTWFLDPPISKSITEWQPKSYMRFSHLWGFWKIGHFWKIDQFWKKCHLFFILQKTRFQIVPGVLDDTFFAIFGIFEIEGAYFWSKIAFLTHFGPILDPILDPLFSDFRKLASK